MGEAEGTADCVYPELRRKRSVAGIIRIREEIQSGNAPPSACISRRDRKCQLTWASVKMEGEIVAVLSDSCLQVKDKVTRSFLHAIYAYGLFSMGTVSTRYQIPEKLTTIAASLGTVRKLPSTCKWW